MWRPRRRGDERRVELAVGLARVDDQRGRAPAGAAARARRAACGARRAAAPRRRARDAAAPRGVTSGARRTASASATTTPTSTTSGEQHRPPDDGSAASERDAGERERRRAASGSSRHRHAAERGATASSALVALELGLGREHEPVRGARRRPCCRRRRASRSRARRGGPRALAAPSRCTAARGLAPSSTLGSVARPAHERDHVAGDLVVDARRVDRRRAPRAAPSAPTTGRTSSSVAGRDAAAREPEHRGPRRPRPGSRRRSRPGSGRAAPRAAGRCPRTRSGSASRARGTGRGSGSRRALDRHLALLHRLEQRGLRLRRRAVDLVGEQHVREHRPAPEDELAAAQRRSSPVTSDGQHVGRELHAPEVEPERARQRAWRAASWRRRARPRAARGRRATARRAAVAVICSWPTTTFSTSPATAS